MSQTKPSKRNTPPEADKYLSARSIASVADDFNNWKDSAKFLKARHLKLSLPTKSLEEFAQDLVTRNILAGEETPVDMMFKNPQKLRPLCEQGYVWACSLYTRSQAFNRFPHGDKHMFSVDNPPDEAFSAAATYACVEGLSSCSIAFINIRGREEAKELENILDFQCDQGFTGSCFAVEEEIAGKLDFRSYCKNAKSCPYLFNEDLNDIRADVIQRAIRNCRADSMDSCERLLDLLPDDSAEAKQAHEQLERLCTERGMCITTMTAEDRAL